MSQVPGRAARPALGDGHYQPLVVVVVAVCAGVLVDRYCPVAAPLGWLAAVGGLVGWLFLHRRGRDRWASGALLVAAAACGAAWHHCCWNLFPSDDLGFCTTAAPQPVCVEAVALTAPRRLPEPPPSALRVSSRNERVAFDVQLARVRDGSAWRRASGRARCRVEGLLPEVRAGDRLLVFARQEAPPAARNPGEFDFAASARSQRRQSVLSARHRDGVTVIARPAWHNPRHWLEGLRTAGHRVLEERLDPQRAPLASAVLLGIREEIEPEATEAFMQTGTVHLLSISGLHVGILAGVLFLVTRLAGLSRGRAAVVVSLLVVLYTVLVGAETPAVRATVLVVAVCLAGYAGRPMLGFNTLAAAALVVLALNPVDLFRIGAQLSFLCMAALSWCGTRLFGLAGPDPIERLAAEHRPWPVQAAVWLTGRAWRIFLLAAVLWLITSPLAAARFHIVSLSALVMNMLVWLPMAVVMWAGMAVLVFAALIPPLAVPCAALCDGALAVMQWLIDCGRAAPASYYWLPGPSDWWLAGFYGGLALCVAFPRRRPRRAWLAAAAVVWLAVGLSAPLVRHWRPRLDCTFVSVGHGCSVVMRLPGGGVILYDAGRLAAPEMAARAISAVLWSDGVTHLDAVVLSHADSDHFNALPKLLEQFSVGAVYVSPVMFEQDRASLAELRAAIERAGVPLGELHGGDQLAAGPDCAVRVLHPPRRGILGSDNANSLVLAVEHRGRRVLLTGDLAPPGVEDLVAEEPLRCDVVLAPHHGSRQSKPAELAAWCTPEWLVISGTARTDVREAAAAFGRAGSQILHTDRCGAIRARVDGNGLWVEPFLRQEAGPEGTDDDAYDSDSPAGTRRGDEAET